MTRGKEMKVSIFLKSEGRKKGKRRSARTSRRVQKKQQRTHFLRILRSQTLGR